MVVTHSEYVALRKFSERSYKTTVIILTSSSSRQQMRWMIPSSCLYRRVFKYRKDKVFSLKIKYILREGRTYFAFSIKFSFFLQKPLHIIKSNLYSNQCHIKPLVSLRNVWLVCRAVNFLRDTPLQNVIPVGEFRRREMAAMQAFSF